jgi:ubiquinone/menaquinone biosynthesis C-methylase UbiE
MSGAIFKWAAPLFDQSARRWSHDDVSAITKRLEPYASPGGHLLDLGGGTGRLGGLLASALRCTVTVLDSSPQMLRYAEDLPGVSTTLGDAADLPFADRLFDAVVIVDALHHFSRQREAVREVARVLKLGGGVLVAEADPRLVGVRMTSIIERTLGEPGAFVAPSDLTTMFSDVGIEGASQAYDGPSYTYVGTRCQPFEVLG